MRCPSGLLLLLALLLLLLRQHCFVVVIRLLPGTTARGSTIPKMQSWVASGLAQLVFASLSPMQGVHTSLEAEVTTFRGSLLTAFACPARGFTDSAHAGSWLRQRRRSARRASSWARMARDQSYRSALDASRTALLHSRAVELTSSTF